MVREEEQMTNLNKKNKNRDGWQITCCEKAAALSSGSRLSQILHDLHGCRCRRRRP